MVYSQPTGEQNGILQAIETLLDLGLGNITSGDANLLAQITLLANKAYDNVCGLILENEGDYVWDESNYTNFPIVTKNLVDNQTDYKLPASASGGDASSFLRLTGVKVLDAAGYLQRLFPIGADTLEPPLENVFFTKGFPKWYRQLGSSLLLYPAADLTMVTATNGLRIEFQRDKVDFLTTDTTKQPGFPSTCHYLLALETAETWAAIKGLRQLPFITAKKQEFMKHLGWDMANRNKDQRQRITSLSARRNNRYE